MQSKATTVAAYLAELAPERRAILVTVREVILANLPPGFEEGIIYGMIGYYVPHSLYPAGYHCDPKQPLSYAGLALQKHYLSLYMTCMYSGTKDDGWFREEWAKTGKKLDMGKSCIRFKKVEDLALDVIGAAVARVSVAGFIANYEAAIQEYRGQKKRR